MIAKRPDNVSRNTASTGKTSLLPWIVVGAVAAIGVVSLWLLARDAETDGVLPNKTDSQGRPKSVSGPATPVRVHKAAESPVEHSDDDAERKRRQEMFSKMSADEKIEYLRERVKNMPIPETPTNRLYATGLEQAMDWIFSCEVGNPPPLLPPMSLFDRMHLAEILIMDNPVLDTDSEKAAESKEMMKIAKREFIKFLKDGGNPDDFLPYYHGQLVAAHDEYKTARQSIVEIIRNEPDIALDYIKKVNERLSEKGIKNVQIPKKMLDAFGIESEDFE